MDETGPGAETAAIMDELLNSAPCGFVSFSDDGTVTLINATLLDMLGYEPGEVEGRHVERILGVGSRIFYQTHWFPLLRLQGRAEEIFMLLRRKSGEDLGVLVNAVRRERGGATAYDCVLMRVRERQKYEDELLRARRVAEEANRAKSAFLAVMSHELRTPLNAIGGYVQLMEMGIHGPITDAQREALGRVARSQSHLLRLINDVLDLSRIEAGRMEYMIEDVPVKEVVAGVAPMVEPQLESKGVTFAVDVPGDLVARADREKVQQILINVLGNAVKFTPGGGRVSVEAARSAEGSDQLEIRVSDTGIGIPADKLESIFQPFLQVVDERGMHAAEGSGLGLAISRDMARGMGGELAARSALGEGSTLVLTLPAAGVER